MPDRYYRDEYDGDISDKSTIKSCFNKQEV